MESEQVVEKALRKEATLGVAKGAISESSMSAGTAPVGNLWEKIMESDDAALLAATAEISAEDTQKMESEEMMSQILGSSAMPKACNVEISDEIRFKVKELKELCQNEGLALKNDYEAYRLVVVTEGRMKEALKRVRNIRKCESEFNFSQLDPLECFDFFQQQQPGCVPGFSGLDISQRQALPMDVGKFLPSKMLKSREVEARSMRFFSTLMELSCSTLGEFESGVVMLQNAKLLGWKNFSLKLEKRISWMYQEGFPFKVKAVAIVDSGPIMRKIIQLMKAFLSKKMQERIVLVSSKNLCKYIENTSLPKHFGGIVSDDEMRKDFVRRLESFRELEGSFKVE